MNCENGQVLPAIYRSAYERAMSNGLQENRLLSFILGPERFALGLLTVKEVIAVPPQITRVPETPAHFLGIINLRGQLISIVDLRKKLNIKPSSSSSESAIIVCDLETHLFGVVVDAVKAVISPAASDIVPKPDLRGTKSGEYIAGVYKKGSELILLLDIHSLLRSERLLLEEKKAA